ncbi:tryptophan halogenase [Litorimonas taeanensis]|uniref:Tryptophan halogenase n=1 Tax=Litorimonas taeanensis TaxID=568099 RepID=A0A420WJG8_9PROT|nr:tryptophan halogenase family protein [Litorimonas taeanensis]RKQ71163.1 tryptophan halogenase [Litorimonas taeanensis]
MKAPSSALNHIIIAGGGTAGWMTAAALSRLIENKQTRITLIESDAIGTVGVGEATIPPIVGFNQLLGIPEEDFIKFTNATFKLGIEFKNWYNGKDSYIHPFGSYGQDIEAIKFYQIWLKLNALGKVPNIDEFCLSAVAAYSGKFAPPSPNPNSVMSSLAYAYHFDATQYALLLRSLAESRGVKRVEGKIVDTALNSENGHITSLKLQSGDTIEGDFYIDCTGFKSLLINGALGIEFEDWSHWLPCDRAVTIAGARDSAPAPYTRATALTAGWQWRIPLQHRTGNGHVYSSQYITDDDAEKALIENLEGNPIGSARKIHFRTGRRKKFFHKNCVAIGLSAGFMEPLESTSIHLIQAGISKLIALLPDPSFNTAEAETYNNLTHMQFEQTRDFLILHYKATQRTDSDFWTYVKNMDIPDSLQMKLELFKSKGRIFRFQDELFGEDNWAAVLLGQKVMPRSWDPLVDTLDTQQLSNHLAGMHQLIRRTAEQMPDHQSYIDQLVRKTTR